MRTGAVVRALAAGAAGVVLGGVATLWVQPESTAGNGRRAPVREQVAEIPVRPTTFLAWTWGGLPEGFAERVGALPEIRRIVAVVNDNAWLDGSLSDQGEVVDDPQRPYAIPIDVSAARPGDLAPFLPPADRSVITVLTDGHAILGASSARLRGLGPGSVLVFGSRRVEVGAVLPDELVGAAEVFLSRRAASGIGVTHERYALVQTRRPTTSDRLEDRIETVLGPNVRVRVRAPGETPFFRQGDAVLPPVQIKLLFGEFAARPAPGRPGYLEIDPAWARTHIATRRIPLLGQVTCNRALMPQIRGVVDELRERELAGLVRSFSGCYAPRLVNRIPTATLSHHSWGIALDINVPENPFGQRPDQDPRLVKTFERWGFIWAGHFLVPDGMHFEYHRPPASG